MREIRLARPEDYQPILDILNIEIKQRRYTALLTPVTLESRKDWFQAHQDGRHPIYVALENGQVAGWMAVTAYRDGREGFCHACEVSYYLHPNFTGRGIASDLMKYVKAVSYRSGIKHLMAIIFSNNTPSRHLAEKHGFEIWGRFPNIVEIDSTEKDCLQYGVRLTEADVQAL